MHFIVCPHCRRQLRLARSGAEFPSGTVTCRYCCATFSATVLETPDGSPMPAAHEVYEHLLVEYDSSHLYTAYAKREETAAQVEVIEPAKPADKPETAEPEFSVPAVDKTAGEEKIAAFAAGSGGGDNMETPSPKIGKRHEESAPTPVPIPVAIPKPTPVPVPPPASKPAPVPVPPPASKPTPAADENPRPVEPIELKEHEVFPEAATDEPVENPIDALAGLSQQHDESESVKIDSAPRQPVVMKRKKTSPIAIVAMLLIIASCIYGIYFGVDLFIKRYKLNEETKEKIELTKKQQAEKKKAQPQEEDENGIPVQPELKLDVIEDANIVQFQQLPARQPGEPAFYTGKFRSGPNSPLEVARVELTLSDFGGKNVTLKSDVYHNIPADSEIMFSVTSDMPVTEDMTLDQKTVTGKKAPAGTIGWNIDEYSRENSKNSIHVFGHTKNNTERAVKDIYIWCDFFTRDGLFAGSAKGTIPAEVLELKPGSTVTYNIVFDLNDSTALMPETVKFVMPRLTGKAAQ